ncbi:MAG: hypothetical protein AAF960_11745 [Bacteroidota bacterium]
MIQNNSNNAKRWVEQLSTDRFVFCTYVSLVALFSLVISSCGEPEIKLLRADRRHIDTVVDNQIKLMEPMLDSLCEANQAVLLQKAVDSIVAERKKREERLRLKKE